MSWTVDDPGQGDPAVIAALAADLEAQADDALAAGRQLRGLQANTTDAVWRGTAADAFRSRVGDLPPHLDKMHLSYQAAADGMRAYAAAVQQLGDEAAVQKRLLAEAEADRAAQTAAQQAWTPPLDPVTSQPSPGVPNPYDEAAAAAAASAARARAVLGDLANQRSVADQRVISSLRQAHHVGMKNKSWWQRSLNVASAVLSKLTVVLIVIAIVAIVVLAVVAPELIPGLLLVAGDLLTALSGAQLAVDATRKAMGEDVSWGALAVDALGLLPGLGDLAAAGRLGERALASSVRLSEAVAQGADYLTQTARTLRTAGSAFVDSVWADAKNVRYVVRAVDTGAGAVMPMLAREGKTAGQMFTEAKAAAKAVRTGEAALTSTAVDIEHAMFAQNNFGETFSKRGKFKNMTIDDVVGKLESGALSVDDIEINVVVREGTTLITNTRSAEVLARAGVLRSAWNVVDRTDDKLFEKLLDMQLANNRLDSGGFANPVSRGRR